MDQAKNQNQMTNTGQKALANQVNHLRNEYAKMHDRNTRLTNEVRLLQSVQLSMIESSFFVGLWHWFRKWRNFRNTTMVKYDGKKWPKGSSLAADESGRLFIAPPGTPKDEIVVTL